MAGLVLKLAPRERLLINGAVIENGDRRSKISILTADANILRLKDAIHPDSAHTPVRRVCYLAQLALSGDIRPEKARDQLILHIEELSQIFTDADSRKCIKRATEGVTSGQFYQTLKALRILIPREDRLLVVGQK